MKVAGRMTCYMPGKAKRNDIPVGTPATVVGLPDATSGDRVIIKVLLSIEKGAAPVEVAHVAFTDCLKFDHEDLEDLDPNEEKSKALEEAETSHGHSKKRAASWALLDSVPEQVLEEPQWPKLLADTDPLIQNFGVRSRIGVMLQGLIEALPQYTPKDLAVIERQTPHGVWRSEVWTKREFAPRELIFAPSSSQLKETHVMSAANCPIALPAHGPGAHPEGHNVALDGRTRTSIARKGLIDGEEHIGSLFWLVQRTSEATEANMSLEQTSFEMSCTIHVVKKLKHHSNWDSEDLPKIPVRMNRKTIKQHQRLAVFLEPKKDGAERSSGSSGLEKKGSGNLDKQG